MPPQPEAGRRKPARHATCVDSRGPHGSQPVQIFPSAPLIRASQKNAIGINPSDGTSVLTPAINQYENCLRCHGTSSGKQVQPIYGYFPVRAVAAGDPLNLGSQFASNLPTLSSHPVMPIRNSSNSQPTRLPNMVFLHGHPTA